jgi:hypothetical protein
MSRIVPLLLYAVFALSTVLRPAEAQQRAPYFQTPPQLDISPRKPLPPVTRGQTYAVDIHCKPRRAQLFPITDNGLIRTTYTTSHAILVSSQQATSATIAPGTLPTNGLGMTVVYVTDGSTGSELDNRQSDGCKSTFLIRRQTNVFLIPFISLHTANQAGIIVNIFSAVLTPFTSLFSLITGGPLAATASTRITDFQNVATGFNSILGKLNQDYNYAKTVSLGVGTTTITTSESVTTVTVRPVPVFITDKIDDFSNALRTLADSETVKVTQANPDTSCNQLSNNVALDGIAAPEDRAYILGYEGLRNLQTADDMMRCLGRLVKVGAGIPAIWADQQPDMTVTPTMADAFLANNYPVAQQLSFSTIQGTLDNLMTALGRYARNGQPPSTTNSAALKKFFVDNVNLVDSSATEVFKSASIPTGFPQIIDFLIQRGYYRFGCYAQTTNQTGLAALKVNSIFLAFKALPDATTAKTNETLVIHPMFSANLYTIQALDVSDNVSWISNVLAGIKPSPPTTFACGELKVE